MHKSFGRVHALRGVDLAVPAGTVLGLLGPNGAGKTTMVRILTTLLAPDRGRAQVGGLDVVREAATVRASIGLAGQYAAVDEYLTGRENLELMGRLYHLPAPEASRRAAELLDRFELTEAADRQAGTFSGGMRRRLDLGASLVNRPPILFLDEPTAGLDPRSRLGLWDVIGELVAEGTTLLLTTQYLEEADRLAHRVAVIDHGTVIAEGTPDELKTKVGGDLLAVTVAPPEATARAAEALRPIASGDLHADEGAASLTVPVASGDGAVAEAVRRLDAAGVAVVDIALRRPTLDDVFLSLTGHEAGEGTDGPAPEDGEAPRGRRRGRKGPG